MLLLSEKLKKQSVMARLLPIIHGMKNGIQHGMERDFVDFGPCRNTENVNG
jgi:hypothetical protein